MGNPVLAFGGAKGSCTLAPRKTLQDLLNARQDSHNVFKSTEEASYSDTIVFMETVGSHRRRQIFLLKNGLKPYFCVEGYFGLLRYFENLKTKKKVRTLGHRCSTGQKHSDA
ncbi:hypothetical protein FNV43_RR20938 [Rhamnella rubrinervis]|uniref:Uncharacterized protein n=1 Tax=Rhamnella rubrinervis TaxID=2594499 RepID=A0A8K0E0R2_9ROSA|nr:hypothetical protein FNV43_RR20938 [Rhamnella rubrinervis]